MGWAITIKNKKDYGLNKLTKVEIGIIRVKIYIANKIGLQLKLNYKNFKTRIIKHSIITVFTRPFEKGSSCHNQYTWGKLTLSPILDLVW